MNLKYGLLDTATHRPAHPGRVGGPISPCAITVHTTDMPPESFGALIDSWTTRPAAGDCAHFVIGRTPDEGVVQLVPISRNANHAGGPHHGWFVDAKGNQWHPNEISVGIELHCAGLVHPFADGWWRLIEDGKPVGTPIPASDVIPPGYHKVTDWQYQQLDAIIGALLAVMPQPPAGLRAVSPSQKPAPWAAGAGLGRVVGHCSLDYLERSDPWPPTMQRIRALYGSDRG